MRSISARGGGCPAKDNRSLTYREMARQLGDYVTDLGFTHVELMPVMEHPFDGFVGLPGHRIFRARPRAIGTSRRFRYLID